VDGTVETVLTVDGSIMTAVNFNADSLVFTLITPRSWTADPFNGPQFTVLSGDLFGSVIGIHANLQCTPCSPVEAFVLGDTLFVNWQGGGGNTGDTITIDFAPVSAVPLPSTWVLMLTGFAGLAALRLFRIPRAISAV
jgi:hypothetical protein